MLAALFAVVCYAMMLLAFALMAAFMANVSFLPRTLERGPQSTVAAALACDLALIALFGLVHSIMARHWFKRWLCRTVPERLERSVYVLVSSVLLMLMVLLWLPVRGAPLWALHGPASIAARFVGLAGFAVAALGTFMIDHLEMMGLRQALSLRPADAHLGRPYLYAHVRHPIYTGALIGLWVTPEMGAGRLLIASAFTAYTLVGARFEERDLVRSFGDEYLRYQREVPMLLPRPWRRKRL